MSKSLSSLVLKSSGILFLLRFVQRSIGLLSTLIMARILAPADFGIIAIVALIVHFCEILSTTGTEQYLIHKSETDDIDLHSAWTLDIILKTSLWLIIIVTSPLINKLYAEVELVLPLIFASSVLVINALKNPAIALLKKAFTYKKLFYLGLVQKLTAFVVGVSIAIIYETFWAILIIDVVAGIIFTIGSYLIHEFRPRLSLERVRLQFEFSKWLLFKGGIGYVRAQLDVIFISRLFSAEVMGAFHLSRHIATLPSTELVTPVMEPLLASFSKVKADAKELAYQVDLSLLVVQCLVWPICVYFFFFSASVIDVLLGSQWQSAHELLSAMSITVLVFSLSPIFTTCCIALGKVKQIFYYDLFSLVFATLCLLLFIDFGAKEFILTRGIVAFIPLLVLVVYLARFIPLKLTITIFNVLPILASCVVSVLLTGFVFDYIPSELFSLFVLIILASVFFTSYALCLLFWLKLLDQKSIVWSALHRILKENVYKYVPVINKKHI